MPTATRSDILISNLSFSYRSRVVFENVTVALQPGMNFVVGVNGAGKTTLFRLVLGELRPTRGTHADIRVRGDGADRCPSVTGIGYLPQAFGYPPHFTVSEFVGYFAWLRGVPRARRTALTNKAVALVRLTDRADSKMGTLSGGMLRRAGLAQALVHEPDVVLLDEPTVGLDPRQRADLRELFTLLAQETTLVVSTHLLEDVAAIGGHVVVLHDGTVRFSGAATELAALANGGAATAGGAGGMDDSGGSSLGAAFLRLTDTTGDNR